MERYNNEFTLRVNSGGGDQEVTSVLGTNRWFEMDWASVVLGNRLPSHSESDFQGKWCDELSKRGNYSLKVAPLSILKDLKPK